MAKHGHSLDMSQASATFRSSLYENKHKYPYTHQLQTTLHPSKHNIHTSNDVMSLQQKLNELQQEMACLDDEHAQMEGEQLYLQRESERIKHQNKTLFNSVASQQQHEQSEIGSDK